MSVPTIQEDGREQRGARRPDTSGDVPGAEGGGGNGHPKGGGMAKWMEDEQNLSTRRGVGWCKHSPAVPRPSLPASRVASRPVLPRGPSYRGNPWSPVSGSPVSPPSRAPPSPPVPGSPAALPPGLPRGFPPRAPPLLLVPVYPVVPRPWLPRGPPVTGSPVAPRPGLPRSPPPGLPRGPPPRDPRWHQSRAPPL